MIIKDGRVLGYADDYRDALESARAIGATVKPAEEEEKWLMEAKKFAARPYIDERYQTIPPDARVQKIFASHDWVWVKIAGGWLEARTKHDALYEPQEWINEILAIQKMTVKEFVDKYGSSGVPKEYWDEAEKYSTRRYTRKELEKKAGWLKLTHGR